MSRVGVATAVLRSAGLFLAALSLVGLILWLLETGGDGSALDEEYRVRVLGNSCLRLAASILVVGGARLFARALAGPDRPWRMSDLPRLAEISAGIWCARAAVLALVAEFVLPRWSFAEVSFATWDPEVHFWVRTGILALLAAVLLAGPGRAGRWIQSVVGPIRRAPESDRPPEEGGGAGLH